jgi:hypothetical protein
MVQLLAFLCRNFAGVIEAGRNGRKILLDTCHIWLDVEFIPTGDVRLSGESAGQLCALLAAGYTVTALISDEKVVIPFLDAVEFYAAESVNAMIWQNYGDQIVLP